MNPLKPPCMRKNSHAKKGAEEGAKIGAKIGRPLGPVGSGIGVT